MSEEPDRAAGGEAETVGKKTTPGSVVSRWRCAGGERQPEEPRFDQVPIRLLSGEQAWVLASAFNLISEKESRDSERLRRLRDQRNMALAVAAVVTIVLARS